MNMPGALSTLAAMNCEHCLIQQQIERESPREKCEVCSSVVWDLCGYHTREMTHLPHHTVSRSHCVMYCLVSQSLLTSVWLCCVAG